MATAKQTAMKSKIKTQKKVKVKLLLNFHNKYLVKYFFDRYKRGDYILIYAIANLLFVLLTILNYLIAYLIIYLFINVILVD